MGKDSLAQIAQIAQIAPAETAIGHPTATARRLVDASVSANTRSAYAGALGQLDTWLAGRRLDDAAGSGPRTWQRQVRTVEPGQQRRERPGPALRAAQGPRLEPG